MNRAVRDEPLFGGGIYKNITKMFLLGENRKKMVLQGDVGKERKWFC